MPPGAPSPQATRAEGDDQGGETRAAGSYRLRCGAGGGAARTAGPQALRRPEHWVRGLRREGGSSLCARLATAPGRFRSQVHSATSSRGVSAALSQHCAREPKRSRGTTEVVFPDSGGNT